MSRIFISHSSANNAKALALGSWLDANGWSDYFLDIDADRGIHPGERWMAALAGAVDRCEAVIFLVSPAWRDSKFCFAEFFEAKKLGKRIFGVIVEPIPLSQLPEQMTAEWQVCDLTDALDPVPFTVARLPWVPQTSVDFPRGALDSLARGLRKAGLDASSFVWPPEAQPDRSPYPGLRALDEMDAAVFFGRDAAVVRAIDQLRLVRERDVERAFVVLGASGAGKSSFLRAGLLPRLRRDSDHFIVLPPIRPERAAISGSLGLLASLKGALAATGQVLSPAQVRTELATIGLAGILGRIGATLRRTNRSLGLAQPTLIVPIDQAEELFASDGRDEALQFLAHLETLGPQAARTEPAAAADDRRPRILFVLTIRSDSLQTLQSQPALQALSPVLFSLPAMPVAEFKAVIEGPARRHTRTVKPLVIAPRLTEQLVVDAQGADALPLLALTLEWLYREFTNDQGTRIGRDEYERLGGVRGVIGMAVERAFERPGAEPAIPPGKPEQDRLLQQLFPYLATVDPDTGDWKRRVALRGALRSQLPAVDALVSRLVEQRLLLVDSRRLADGAEPVEIVEVAHEALLRQWDALERWLREFGAALAASESIRRAANDWNRSERDAALLVHTAHRLQAAEALLSDERLAGRFEAVDAAYLAACRARDRRELEDREDQLRRIAEQQAARATLQRRMAWGLAAVAMVVAGMGIWIVMQTRAVSLQTSLLLAGAAEAAADEKRYDRALRLGALAARASWFRPAHPTAAAALSRAADGSNLRARFGHHTGAVWSASFSADGKRVVTASSDHTARVWMADTGEPVGTPMKHDGTVVSARFNVDGMRVVTASDDTTARVWDADSGNPVGAPMKHASKVFSAEFSPDGRHVLTTSADLMGGLWDATTGEPVDAPKRLFKAEYYQLDGRRSASYSPDGKRLFTLPGDGSAQVRDAMTGAPIGVALADINRLFPTSFSFDGKLVLTAWRDGARIWDTQTGKPVGEPLAHLAPVLSASFSPDGKFVVTAGRDNRAQVWDATNGKPVGHLMVHEAPVASAVFSPNGLLVVTASDDGTARVWDAATGQPVGEPLMHAQAVNAAQFSPDSTRVVTASDDQTAGVWDADTGRLLASTSPLRREAGPASIVSDGQRLLATSGNGTAQVRDGKTGQAIGDPLANAAHVFPGSFSPDGKRVVTASTDNTVQIWNADTGKPMGDPMPHRVAVRAVNFSPTGKRLVTESEDKTFHLWDAETGKAIGSQLPGGEAVTFVGFSPDGRRMALVLNPTTVSLWAADRGESLGQPMKHAGQVNATEFSSDGKHVLTASKDTTARIWDADTGKPVGAPLTHAEEVRSASFAMDGKRVVTAAGDKVRLWDAETGQLQGQLLTPRTFDEGVFSATFSPNGQRILMHTREYARVWDADTGKPVGEPLSPRRGIIDSATFSPDGQRVVTTPWEDGATNVWNVVWSSFTRPDELILEVCRRKLRGNVRRITEADVAASRGLDPNRVGEEVCHGAP